MTDIQQRELRRRAFYEGIGRAVVVVVTGAIVLVGVLTLLSPGYLQLR